MKTGTGTGQGGVVTVGELSRIERPEWLRGRIIRLIDAGVPRMDYVGGFAAGRERVQMGWEQSPGSHAWWALRQRLGGRVTAAEFADAIDALIAEGLLIEVWLTPPARRQTPHCLLLPGRSDGLRHPVARARAAPTCSPASRGTRPCEAGSARGIRGDNRGTRRRVFEEDSRAPARHDQGKIKASRFPVSE